jgi:hypothetical protein
MGACVCVCACARAYIHTPQLQKVLHIKSEVTDATAAIIEPAVKREHILQNTSPMCFQLQK